MYVTELVAPNATLIPRCWELWRETTNFESLTKYTLCCREILRNYTTTNIFIYGKGKGWARDAWLTNSHWSPRRDFMFHAMKEQYRKEFSIEDIGTFQCPPYFPWISPFRTPMNPELCRKGMFIWDHEPGLIASARSLEKHMAIRRREVDEEYRRKLIYIELNNTVWSNRTV
ncbi:hypothetical protein OSTOST_04576 [Ostertagia ostertagi]